MIVGLCGYAQVGKDTLAKELNNGYGHYGETPDRKYWHQFALADMLKMEVESMLEAVGINVDFANEELKRQWRDLLVFWGRKRREQEFNYWIKKLFNSQGFQNIFKNPEKYNIIITDVRYLNEVYHIIQNLGGMVVRIHRIGYNGANDEEYKTITEIDSQIALPSIYNNGTPEDMINQFFKIIENYRAKS